MTHDPVLSFGSLLRRMRLGAGLTQEELAGRAGLSVDAIASLERGRRLAPRARTVRLLADALGLSAPEQAALRATAKPRHPTRAGRSLPRAAGALIGRERECEEIVRLLRREDLRLLTLTGPGGVGKTRLAIHVAAEIADDHSGGAALVSLSPVRDPGLVAGTIAQTLGLGAGPRPAEEQLLAHLASREMLLLLDNFEHLLDAGSLLTRIASECARVTLLVTSRAALGLRAEQQFRVAPLTLRPPGEKQSGSPAVELFVTRASAVCPGFTRHASNSEAIAQICRRLDGLPLAIELAAARANVLGPAELCDRLGRSLELLDRGPRDLPTRQRTLRATIDWSHALLPEPARELFATIAVFEGGATLGAIERVNDGWNKARVLDGLATLVDHNLVLADDVGGSRRFSMLATIQEYGRERLAERGETEPTRRRHALCYLELANQAEAEFDGANQTIWLERLDRERDNFRAALSWSAARGAADIGLRLASALWWYWTYHGQLREGRAAIEQLLERPAALAGPDSLRARALGVLGWLCMHQGEFAAARGNIEASLTLARRCADAHSIAFALTGLGSLGVWTGAADHAHQRALLEEACARWRELPGATGLHFAVRTLGVLALVEGDLTAARELVRQSLALAGEGRHLQIAQSSCVLGVIAQAGGDTDEATLRFRQSLEHNQLAGDPFILAYSLEGLAWVASTQHRAERSARLLGAAAGLRAEIGSPVASPTENAHDALITALRDVLGAERYERARTDGAVLTIEDAVVYALDRQ